MDDTQIFMRQHHGVFFCLCHIRINLCMPGIMMTRQINRFLIYRIGHRTVNLMIHRQADCLLNITERSLSCHRRNLSPFQPAHVHKLHIQYVNRSPAKQRPVR